MAAGCKAAIGCVDARVPVRASYVSLYKWPESDAEFVRSVAMARRHQIGEESPGAGAGAAATACYYDGNASSRRRAGVGDVPGYCCSPRVVDSYSCRQMYLRSYTFSKRKETVPERTMACLGRVRERAAVFPFLPQRGGGGSGAGSVGSTSSAAAGGGHCVREEDGRRRTSGKGRRKRRKKKKRCDVMRRLQEASCGAVRAVFRRLLACTTTVDIEVAGPPSSR